MLSDEEEMSVQKEEEKLDEVHITLMDILTNNEEQTNTQAAKAPNLPKEKTTDTKNGVLNVTLNYEKDYNYIYKL